jgi:hypothetical protein
MTNTAKTAKAPIIHAAGTRVLITRGHYRGTEDVVYGTVGKTHILTKVSGYFSGASLKAL